MAKIETTEHGQQWLREALADNFDNIGNGMTHLPCDGRYWCPDIDAFDDIIDGCRVLAKEYVEWQFDCNNFAFYFQSQVAYEYGVNAVGVVIDYSGRHAYNVIVYDDGSCALYEPQTGEFVNRGDDMSDHEAYAFEEGFIIL